MCVCFLFPVRGWISHPATQQKSLTHRPGESHHFSYKCDLSCFCFHLPAPSMELDHKDFLPLCIVLCDTICWVILLQQRERVRRDTAPGSGFLQSLRHKCSCAGLRAKENHLPCLSSSRGTCTYGCVCGVRPGLVGWGGEGGKQDRPWVGCKSSPERGCRVYHL